MVRNGQVQFMFFALTLFSTLSNFLIHPIKESLDRFSEIELLQKTPRARTLGEEIRRFGCHRTETPLIFVHIGKSGGGSVRARFAAAAQNYTREKWQDPGEDNHFYPVSTGANARFCNSLNSNHRKPNSKIQSISFEGNVKCNATTPIGMAVACPEKTRCEGCELETKDCHVVYTGHNIMGTELHWLPPQYLYDWWDTHWSVYPEEASSMILTTGIQSLAPHDESWCPDQSQARPLDRSDIGKKYKQCGAPLASRMDSEFKQFWQQQTNEISNYSPIYASLPLHRVVLLRDPFSYLLSQFIFHGHFKEGIRCDDIESASDKWAYNYTLKYIIYLCGDDCVNRVEYGMMSLRDLEAQAGSNLRNAFSVVGLLSEIDEFYDMVTTRIHYVNMSQNLHVKGELHATKSTTPAYIRCTKAFQNKTFQEQFKEKLPIVGTLERLYQVGVEVNRFQKEELRQCSSLPRNHELLSV